jgi:hypothetical protein
MIDFFPVRDKYTYDFFLFYTLKVLYKILRTMFIHFCIQGILKRKQLK